jgi:hypothetical protein
VKCTFLLGEVYLDAQVNAGVYAFLDQFYLLGVGNPLIATAFSGDVSEPESVAIIGLGAVMIMVKKRRTS